MAFRDWSRTCMDMQGYKLTPSEKARLDIPIRFAPAVCALLAAAFGLGRSAPGLLALAVIAGGGAVLPRHPFDYVYGWALAPLLRTGWAPPNTPQRRFACGAAAAMAAIAAVLLTQDMALLGSTLALFVAIVAVVVASTHWCLPSAIYNRVPGLPGRV